MGTESASAPILASFSRVWLQVVAVALFLITTTIVSPSEFGEFAIASAITMFAAVFAGHGHYEFILKGDNHDTLPSTVMCLNLASAAALAGVLCVASTSVDNWFGSQNVGRLLIWLAPVLLVQAVCAVLEPILLRHARLAYVSMSVIIAESIALTAALAALAYGAGIFSLVIHKWCREACHFLILVGGKRWRPRLAFDFRVAIASFRFASGIICSRTGTTVILYGAELIVGLILSPTAAGLYRLANKIVSAVSEVVLYALRMMLWIRLPAAQHDTAAFSREVVSAYETAGVAYFAVVPGIATLSWIVFPSFFSPDWHPAVAAIAILAAARLIGFPAYVTEPIMAIRNRTDLLFMFNTVTGLVSLGTLFLIGRYGLAWAAWSQVIAAVVWAGMAVRIIRRLDAAPLVILLSLPFKLSLCAGAMVLSGLALEQTGDLAKLSVSLHLLVTIAGSALAYIAAVLLLARGAARHYVRIAIELFNHVARRANSSTT